MMDIEADIALWISWAEKHANNEHANPIIRKTQQAKIDTFKTVPRELPKLKCEIALKQKAIENCSTHPEKDILWAELDSLKSILPLLNLQKNGGPEGGFSQQERS